MLKIRLQGTKNDIRWFVRLLQRDKRFEVNNVSTFFDNVGTDKYKTRKSEYKKDGWIISDKDQKIIADSELGPVEKQVKKGQAIPIPLGKDHLHPQTSACFIQSVGDTMEDIMSGLKMQEATDAEKKKQVGNIVMSLEGELLDTKWTEAGKDMTRVSDGAAAGRVYWKS